MIKRSLPFLVFFLGTLFAIGAKADTLPEDLRSHSLVAFDNENKSSLSLAGSTFGELAASKNVKAIVILAHGASCPVMRQNMRELQALFSNYKEKGVAVLVVNSLIQDQGHEKRESVKKESESFGLTEPIYSDDSQALIKGVGLTTVGELAIIDAKKWAVVFRGGVSDRVNYDFARPKPKNEYAKKALDDLLAGRTPQMRAPVFGCAITFKK
ncbi:MAG: redoxin family protein [Bdellovibrionales bacterium]|nr:redoxin family protein [Bdellovibrionales bacterium]